MTSVFANHNPASAASAAVAQAAELLTPPQSTQLSQTATLPSLTEQQIRLVKSTIPLLQSAGVAVTAHFYQRLFEHHPELQHVFNMSNQHNGRQQFALFSAIAAFACHIDDLGQLQAMLERVANKHTSFFIQPAHYAIVGRHLIATLEELAPAAFSPAIADAWRAAYQCLASLMIEREQALYQQKQQAQGGWHGSRPFQVIAKTMESALVCSFILKPLDGQPVLAYQAGQYIGIRLQPSQSDHQAIRQYSLSDRSNGHSYRISVKRERLPQPGLVSNFLHDEVDIGTVVDVFPPAGDFVLQSTPQPTVLISAGVGITPMMAMLETLAASGHNPPVWFLHACEEQAQHSFAARLSELVRQQDNLCSLYWYRHCGGVTLPRQRGFDGLMQLETIAAELPLASGQFYLCGPQAFMQAQYQQLRKLGVPADRIHYELFGPHSELSA